MSDETWAAVEQAIQDHLHDVVNDQTLLTDWYVILAGAGSDPKFSEYVHISSDTPPHSLEGLINRAKRQLAYGADEDEEL